MNILITITDIQNIRPIAQALTDIARIEPFIAEAQQVELKRLLGSEMLYDLIANPTQLNYANLLAGLTYANKNGNNVKCEGLKTVLAYFSYARFLINDNVKHTDSGFVVKTNQFSLPASSGAIRDRYQDARSMALSHWEDCEAYLNQNFNSYPLWRNGCESNRNGIASSARISSINNRDRYGHI